MWDSKLSCDDNKGFTLIDELPSSQKYTLWRNLTAKRNVSGPYIGTYCGMQRRGLLGKRGSWSNMFWVHLLILWCVIWVINHFPLVKVKNATWNQEIPDGYIMTGLISNNLSCYMRKNFMSEHLKMCLVQKRPVSHSCRKLYLSPQSVGDSIHTVSIQ